MVVYAWREHATCIHAAEWGRNNVTMPCLFEMCRAYGVKVSEFFEMVEHERGE